MGVLKFQLTSPDPASRLADLRKAYVTGLDRTPSRLSVEFRQGVMHCQRDGSESGRFFVPWPVAGHGKPILGTATLGDAGTPITSRSNSHADGSTTSATRWPTGGKWA